MRCFICSRCARVAPSAIVIAFLSAILIQSRSASATEFAVLRQRLASDPVKLDPTIATNGDLLVFKESNSAGDSALMARSGGGNIITIIGRTAAEGAVSAPSDIGPDGMVTFKLGPVNGGIERPGTWTASTGVIVSDWPFDAPGEPACFTNGRYVLRAGVPIRADAYGIQSAPRSGGPVITLTGDPWGRISERISSRNETVVFKGARDVGSDDGIYAISPGGVLITLTGSNFREVGNPSTNGSDVVFKASQNGKAGLFAAPAGGGVVITLQGRDFASFTSFADPVIDADGDVAAVATDGSGKQSLLCGKTTHFRSLATSLDPVISVGDAFMGSTLTSIALSPTSLIAANDSVVFYATLADGSAGFFQASNVPEPTCIGALLAAATVALGSRRRRR